MSRNLLRSIFGLALLAMTPTVGCAAAGPPASDRQLTKVGPELRALYEAYREGRATGTTPRLNPNLPVVGDRVVVDAVAADRIEDLQADLVALGMREAVSAGRIVSGQLPIENIPALAALPSLQFARAAISATQGGAGRGVR
jgi:hypothetical protein